MTTVLSALPVLLDGRDLETEELALFQGFRRTDLVIVPVRYGHKPVVVVASRSDAWRTSKSALIQLKRLSRSSRRRVVLVPGGWLRRSTFLVNCAMIGLSRTVKVTATLRMAVADQLQADPLTTLRDCVSQITHHDDPVGAVLAMVGEGMLRLNLREPIRLESHVSFA